MLVEPRLTFSLVESSRRKGKDGSARAYRAVLKREKPLGTDEVIKECVKDAGLGEEKAGQVRRNFNEWRKPIGKIDKVYSAPDGEIGNLKFGADIVIEGHDLKLKEGDGVHLFVTYKRDPFGLGKGPTTHAFGCDVKENTDTRLVVGFPKSRVLTPDVAIGQPGQLARFEFSTETKKGKHHHGRRAAVVFVE